MTAQIDTILILREADVHLLLDLTSGRLPAVLHWGAALRHHRRP